MLLKSTKAIWLTFFLIILYGCERDLVSPDTPTQEQRNIVSAQDIPGVIQTLQLELGLQNYISEFSTSGGNEQSSLKIDWDQILQLIDSAGNETYTFGIADKDPNPYTFYNLILQFNAEKQAHQPFLLRYELDEEFFPEYVKTGSLANFTGSVSKWLLNPTGPARNQNIAAIDPTATFNVTSCPGSGVHYTAGTGSISGGGWTSSLGPSLLDPEPVSTITCTTYLNYTVWRNADGSLNNIQFGSIEIDCEETPGGSSSSDGDENCAPLDGEIPILPPNFLLDAIDIDDSVDECLRKVINNSLIEGFSQNKIASIMEKFASVNPNYNVLIKQAPLDDIFKAKTSLKYDRETGTVTITFNSDLMENSTDISLLATLYHEMIHAYVVAGTNTATDLDEKEVLFGPGYLNTHTNAGHDYIARYYVQPMSELLAAYGLQHGITSTDEDFFLNLSYNGLTRYRNQTEQEIFQELVPEAADRKKIEDTIMIEGQGKDTDGNEQPQTGNDAGC